MRALEKTFTVAATDLCDCRSDVVYMYRLKPCPAVAE
jgi:hypothetical protein